MALRSVFQASMLTTYHETMNNPAVFPFWLRKNNVARLATKFESSESLLFFIIFFAEP